MAKFVKKDCFAYQKKGKCKALKKMDCLDCVFYKTKKRVQSHGDKN